MHLPKVRRFTNSPLSSALNDDTKLVTMDEKTVIAEFHRPHFFKNKQRARLEVRPAGMNMLDYIILTFVIVDQRRREREARARHTVPWAVA